MPQLVELKPLEIGLDVRASVLRVLEANWPFVMVARRADGQWEISKWIPARNHFEAIGALTAAQIRILSDEKDGE